MATKSNAINLKYIFLLMLTVFLPQQHKHPHLLQKTEHPKKLIIVSLKAETILGVIRIAKDKSRKNGDIKA